MGISVSVSLAWPAYKSQMKCFWVLMCQLTQAQTFYRYTENFASINKTQLQITLSKDCTSSMMTQLKGSCPSRRKAFSRTVLPLVLSVQQITWAFWSTRAWDSCRLLRHYGRERLTLVKSSYFDMNEARQIEMWQLTSLIFRLRPSLSFRSCIFFLVSTLNC